MKVAFPEDELRPVSCTPLTRDTADSNFELNDVLGNYSLTLVDSLSTLAILASASPEDGETGAKALREFQNGIASLVHEYGDGTERASGHGARARGFDLDSKVQVFETIIRGVGGLLSAHLFAIGELPIAGYTPKRTKRHTMKKVALVDPNPILWPNKFKYDGQLLRLALDLAERLLPAFYTETGMPYPRVNLRHGIPFYQNSPLHNGAPTDAKDNHETTETCSAGAGSLMLEFTALSRLTGDPRFEQLAKRAFWAVWARRSEIGLLGSGIDAEAGHWIGPFAGIGAGTDSFFEYALKTHILTSGLALPNVTQPAGKRSASWLDPNTIFEPLTATENSPDSFLWAWQEAHKAIKRHIYSELHHPHYVNVHLGTGSPQIYWIDSLGAYYPGLLALAGELEEAVSTNLLYTALWTRYGALPERWSVREGQIEGGLNWWPGRPEFIESNYHLYRATEDPWYLHVGEMVLKDIGKRCWTACGWAGLQDVRTGAKSDRMQSFFLGETAKYLYLLFDPDHPLNKLDAPYVFSTEGHPLIVPRKAFKKDEIKMENPSVVTSLVPWTMPMNAETCPTPEPMLPFGKSPTAARMDVFHAGSLIGLHDIPNTRPLEVHPADNTTIIAAPRIVANHTIFPWTLPTGLVPDDALCAPLPFQSGFSIQFPATQAVTPGFNNIPGSHSNLVRVKDNQGILISSLSGAIIHMVKDISEGILQDAEGNFVNEVWRVSKINALTLGRDERVFVSRDVIAGMDDELFSRVMDPVQLDLVIQLRDADSGNNPQAPHDSQECDPDDLDLDQDEATNTSSSDSNGITASASLPDPDQKEVLVPSDYRTILSNLYNQVTAALMDPKATLLPSFTSQIAVKPKTYQTIVIPAILPAGPGAAPLPDVADVPLPDAEGTTTESSSRKRIFMADENCFEALGKEVVDKYQIIVLKRGGCTFSQKLSNIPTPSSKRGLQLVVVVEFHEEGGPPTRASLDEEQFQPYGYRIKRTKRDGQMLKMVTVGGGQKTWDNLGRARGVGVRRRWWVESKEGLRIGNLIVL